MPPDIHPKEKTMIFWVGLILFCLAAVELFGIVWMMAVVMRPPFHIDFLKGLVPLIVGGIVFLLVGAYMMKSERKRGGE